LQWLLLQGNALSGPLLPALASLQQLHWVNLADNRLAGPVPSTWCSSNATFELAGNVGLCGAFHQCYC
jgi:hypothetical protein